MIIMACAYENDISGKIELPFYFSTLVNTVP